MRRRVVMPAALKSSSASTIAWTNAALALGAIFLTSSNVTSFSARAMPLSNTDRRKQRDTGSEGVAEKVV